jgi:hypothetical protein
MSADVPLDSVALEQTGDLGPNFPAAATVLANGKILSSDGGVFRILDPNAASPRWERFGSQSLGGQRRWRPSFAEDPSPGEILVFGGASTNANPPIDALWSLSADGETFEEISTGDGPGGRTSHGAAVVGSRLIVVGGFDENGSSDDVWSLDRESSTWSKVTDMPVAIVGVSVLVVSDSEIWVLGRRDEDYAIEVLSIDIANGSAKRLDVEGTPPERLWSVAPYGSCFAGYESGDTVDSTQPQSWRCVETEQGIRWESAPIDASDYQLGGSSLLGAARPDGTRAYFAGRSVLEAAPSF